jgi:hypothetical protein
MSKADLKAYFDWFLTQIPIRLSILESYVKETPGFEGWSANFTSASLKTLGQWYADHVETRPRNQVEMEEIKRNLSFQMPVSGDELTNKTFSLAIDVAMYFSEVLKRNFSGLHWDLNLKDKRFVDYGQPVLLGFGNVPLNPVSIMVVLAYGIAARDNSGERLFELYEYWSSRVVENSKEE